MGASTELHAREAAANEAARERHGRADSPPPAGAAIVARGVSKTFRIPHYATDTLKERVLHPLRGRGAEELQALDDLDFEVEQGEFFGILGRNGSGKSTLLKLIAGIYQPDRGEVRVAGRLSPFIELGVGFHPELAARDNVLINCSLLGLTRAQGARRFEQILHFAELERFVDLKLKNYSSGMQVRLAFSTAIQVDADILLLDEVLAVGDARFQEKCFEVFRRMKKEGRTIVFVTHNMDVMQRFCDRAMVIENGHMIAIGEPRDVLDRYLKVAGPEAPRPGRGEIGDHYGDGAAELRGAWFEDAAGNRTESVGQGEPFRVCAEVAFQRDMPSPAIVFELRNERGETVTGVSSSRDGVEMPGAAAGERVKVEARFENPFAVGRYHAGVAVLHGDQRAADKRERMASLLVLGDRRLPGAVEVPHEFGFERLT